MEKNDNDADDLGSGWLEVKKKHKSHTKFSNAKGVGACKAYPESLNKQHSITSKSCTLVPRQPRKKVNNISLTPRNQQLAANSAGNSCDVKATLLNVLSKDASESCRCNAVDEQNVRETAPEKIFSLGDNKPSDKFPVPVDSKKIEAGGPIVCDKKGSVLTEQSEHRCQQDFLSLVEKASDKSLEEQSGHINHDKSSAQEGFSNADKGDMIVRADLKEKNSDNSAADRTLVVCNELDVLSLAQVPKIKWGNIDVDELEHTSLLRFGNLSTEFQSKDKNSTPLKTNLQEGLHDCHSLTHNENMSFTHDNSEVPEAKENANNGCKEGESMEVHQSCLDESSSTITSANIASIPKDCFKKTSSIEHLKTIQGDGISKKRSKKYFDFSSQSLAISDAKKETSVESIECCASNSNEHLKQRVVQDLCTQQEVDSWKTETYSTKVEISNERELHNASSGSRYSKDQSDVDNSAITVEEFQNDVNIATNMLLNAFEKGEAGEGKERFRQRLWCFLFENLNRAIDELYLLCELECDIDQMKEADIVLEEALSDFRELKSRIEGFDDVEHSSSTSQTARIIKSKLECRRPHSLSWEVRRLANSPRRAEILSSSLEAFRRVQEETAMKNSSNQEKRKVNVYTNSTIKESDELCGETSGEAELLSSSKDASIKLKVKQMNKSEYVNQHALDKEDSIDASKANKQSSMETRMVQKSMQSSSSKITAKKNENAACSHMSGSSSKTECFTPSTSKVVFEKNSTDNTKSIPHSIPCQAAAMNEGKSIRPLPKSSLDAWKENRNWESILKLPLPVAARSLHSAATSRKSVERMRVLHDKLMSPERRKKCPLDMKREVEEKHARAMRIRRELENERAQRLQKVSEKLSRVSEWQAVRSTRLREGMYARQQRGESRHEAYLAQIARRASDESSKVSEVRFITSLSEENKKLSLQQKLHDSELRRAERLQIMKIKQKEDMAREEAVLERRKLIEAEKLQRLAEMQRKKEEAQARREEERKAASAAREAKAVEQVRKKEVRAKAQKEEAELQAQRLAERLRESEFRRKLYLEQIREKASSDFRDQSSPSCRRPSTRDGHGRLASSQGIDAHLGYSVNGCSSFLAGGTNSLQQHSFKKRVKKIRQRLMTLKFDFVEPQIVTESSGVASISSARSKIGRWLQELQRLRQSRKGGILNIGMIVGELIKYMEGKDLELHAARQSGLLDFLGSALPASHTSKPEACQTTVLLLRVLKVVLTLPANRLYILARNLLPSLILMLSAALENYCTIAASNNSYSSLFGNSASTDKLCDERLEAIGEVLEGLLWCIGAIMAHTCSSEHEIHMKNGLSELIVACKVIHHLRDLFSLFDRPQAEGATFPGPVLLALNLLNIFTCPKGDIFSIDWEIQSAKSATLSRAISFASIAYQENSNLSSTSIFQEKEGKSSSMQDQKEGIKLSGMIFNDKSVMWKETSGGCAVNNLIDTIQVVKNDKEHLEKTILPITKDGREQNALEEDASENHSKNEDRNLVQPLVFETSTSNIADGDEKRHTAKKKNGQVVAIAGYSTCIISAIADTGLVGLLSMLTAIVLQANPRSNPEQAEYVLPSNFEEVATGVLKIMNNLARLDLMLIQNMLAQPDLQMEFFHLMGFLLSHCTSKWRNITDKVALMLYEILLLLGYFSLLNTGNQAVLRWGKTPTIIHKICDLPFAFFTDPLLTPILVGTLLAVCYGCEQNRNVVQQELSMDMLLVLLKSSRQDTNISDSRLDDQHYCPPSFTSSQSGANDNTAQILEKEIQKPLEKEISTKSDDKSVKVSQDSPVTDVFSNPVHHHGFKAKINPSSLDNTNSKKQRGGNKAFSQVDCGKESSTLRSRSLKGKANSANKENLTHQTKHLKTASSDNNPPKTYSAASKRNVASMSEYKLNSNEDNTLLSPIFMVHNRFPVSLIDRAQEFFAAGLE